MITLQQVLDWAEHLKDIYDDQKEYLTRLDSDIGDGDHGINMARGFDAVSAALKTPPADIGAAFKVISMTLIKTVGGASGPLYGTFFLRCSMGFTGKKELSLEDWTAAVEKGIQGIQALGKAQPGDKTMIDAWLPALEALKNNAGSGIPEALKASAEAAEKGMKDTIPVIAKKGRASYLGERSAGHQDPGATSTWLMLRTAAECFSR